MLTVFIALDLAFFLLLINKISLSQKFGFRQSIDLFMITSQEKKSIEKTESLTERNAVSFLPRQTLCI